MKTMVNKCLWRWVSVLWLSIVVSSAVAAESRWTADPKLEAAILNEDWRRVSRLLDSGKSESAVPKMIHAHALLALNRNNESLCLFSQLSSAEAVQVWEDWTQEFAEGYRSAAIAHYFRGDALARLGRWGAALASFNTALGIHPDHPLVLNARGVAYAVTEQWGPALSDLKKTTGLKRSLANAHASYGMLWIHQKTGAKGALHGFDRALKLSPRFSLALYGRGCLKSIGNEWGRAKKDIEDAAKQSRCLTGLITGTAAEIFERIAAREQINLARIEDEKNPAMEIHKNLAALQNANPNQMAAPMQRLGMIGQAFPEYHNTIAQGLRDIAISNPAKATEISRFAVNNIQVSKNYEGLGKTVQELFPPAKGMVSAAMPQLENRAMLGHKIIQTYPSLSPINPASGFKTGLDEAARDDGQWPFVPMYGLFYKVKSNEAIQQVMEGRQ